MSELNPIGEIKFQGQLTKERFLEITKKQRPITKLFVVFMILFSFLLFPLMSGTNSERIRTSLVSTALPILLMVLVFSIMRLVNRNVWTKTEYLHETIQGTINQDGIRWKTAISDITYPWKKLYGLKIEKDFFFIFRRGDLGKEITYTIFFPKEFFSSEQDWINASQFAKARLKGFIVELLKYSLPIVFIILTAIYYDIRALHDPSEFSNHAAVNIDAGNFEQAEQLLNKALKIDANNVNALTNMGVVYDKTGRYDLAVQTLNKAISLDSANAKIFNDRGKAYLDKHEYDLAIQDFNKAIALDPTYTNPLLNRGLAHTASNQLDAAFEDFDAAEKIAPQNPAIYANRASAYMTKGDFDLEERDLNRAIQLNPNLPMVLLLQARLLFNKGEFDGAAENYDKLISQEGKHAELFRTSGIAKYFGSNPTSAIDAFKKALGTKPDDSYSKMWLFLSQLKAGQDAASDLQNNIKQMASTEWPLPILSFYLGQISADDVFTKARMGDENTQRNQTCEANFYIGEYYLLKQNNEEAKTLLHTADQSCPINFDERDDAHAELLRSKF